MSAIAGDLSPNDIRRHRLGNRQLDAVVCRSGRANGSCDEVFACRRQSRAAGPAALQCISGESIVSGRVPGVDQHRRRRTSPESSRRRGRGGSYSTGLFHSFFPARPTIIHSVLDTSWRFMSSPGVTVFHSRPGTVFQCTVVRCRRTRYKGCRVDRVDNRLD